MGVRLSDVVEYRDVYPADVAEQDLQLVYYGEQLIDVEEKPVQVTCQAWSEALN